LNLVREVCKRFGVTSPAALEYDGWRSAAKAVEGQLIAAHIDLGVEIHAGYLTPIANAICKMWSGQQGIYREQAMTRHHPARIVLHPR
jgi:hypothetical protein